MPLAARAPPIAVVRRMPQRSVSTPATGEIRNVVPMHSDPTRAATERRELFD